MNSFYVYLVIHFYLAFLFRHLHSESEQIDPLHKKIQKLINACNNSNLLNTKSKFVLQGTPVKIGEVPFQVSVRYFGRHICGGSIITEDYVLTAAHCVHSKNVIDLTVFIGSILLNCTNGLELNVAEIVEYPEFELEYLLHDIAVVKTQQYMKFNTVIQPIKLTKTEPTVNSVCVVSGWEYITPIKHNISPNLRAANIYVVNKTDCSKSYITINEKLYQNSMICAKDINGEVCQGDSGGPLVCSGELVGIMSWGTGCGMCSYPAVFTDIYFYAPWINENTVAYRSSGVTTEYCYWEIFLFLIFNYEILLLHIQNKELF